MFEAAADLALASPMFAAAIVLTAILLLDAGIRMTQLRYVFAGLTYLTIGLWYFVDPIYNAAGYRTFNSGEFDNAYLQVILFLLGFRFLIAALAPATPTRILRDFDPRQLDRGPIIGALVAAWCGLFFFGISLANFEVLDILFPLRGRAAWGNAMFARGRYAGAMGFLLSSASYSYMLLCAGFGVIMVCTRRKEVRLGMLIMMGLTWPMFALSGSRHTFLAVSLPSILATLLVKRWTPLQRGVFLATCGLVMNVVMLAAIEFRNDGLDKLFTGPQSTDRLAEARHRGLNMPEELMFILRYQQSGALPIENGMNYIEHALNFVPRAIWPDKPMVGRQFAFLRVGMINGDLTATVSYGIIGQGVSNFGPYVGPFAPALLMALFGRFLCRLPRRGNRFARAALILFCLGLVPNIGRDISLLVLWPMIFGYAAVLAYERFLIPRIAAARAKKREQANSYHRPDEWPLVPVPARMPAGLSRPFPRPAPDPAATTVGVRGPSEPLPQTP